MKNKTLGGKTFLLYLPKVLPMNRGEIIGDSSDIIRPMNVYPAAVVDSDLWHFREVAQVVLFL
eukprot:scaffold2471_cov155-Cylindrotheca_fusiformis.AAC.2